MVTMASKGIGRVEDKKGNITLGRELPKRNTTLGIRLIRGTPKGERTLGSSPRMQNLVGFVVGLVGTYVKAFLKPQKVLLEIGNR
jgi:hypothetical protein